MPLNKETKTVPILQYLCWDFIDPWALHCLFILKGDFILDFEGTVLNLAQGSLNAPPSVVSYAFIHSTKMLSILRDINGPDWKALAETTKLLQIFTEVQLTMNLLCSPGIFLVFWQILIVL